MAFGVSLAPYVISAENRGIEYDIIKESLAYKGHTLTPVYMAFIEVPDALVENRADAIATVRKTVGIEGFYSDTAIYYHNSAISLAKNRFVIDKMSDMKDKKVVAFQMATKYLGSDFIEMANANPRYREKSAQKKQVEMLLDGKADVIVSDKYIFLYFLKQAAKPAGADLRVTYHDLFPPSDYSVAFREEAVLKAFNEGLAHLRASGRYDEIVKSYIE